MNKSNILKNKISISTYFYSNNFGAIFQALSLQEFISKKFDQEVCFNKFQPQSFLFHEILKPMMRKKFWKITQVLKKNIKLFFWRLKMNIPFPSILKKSNKYPINIFGSDEIWNFKNHFNGLENFFFGKYTHGEKIAYAVSIGNAKLEKIKSDNLIQISQLIEKFSYISVRDTSTYEFVKKITKKEIPIVLDPCLLDDNNFMDKIKQIPEKSKYAVVYGNYFTENNKMKIIKYCEKNNLKIYSLSYFNEWTENKISLNGDEFINYFKNAEVIFTSTFHGIIFSYKFKKNFWFENDPRKISKSEYFINKLNLNERLIDSSQNFDLKVDYNSSKEIFKEWQNLSQNYLLKAINDNIKN